MKKFLVVGLLLITFAAGFVNAQEIVGEEKDRRFARNEGVVLYLSLAPELTYEEDETFRGLSATPSPEEAMVSGEVSSVPQIAYIMASYPPEATPDLLVATFGLRYTKGIKVLRYGTTPESMPIATRDWPLSGQGISVALIGGPDTSMVAEIGWLAIRAEVPGTIELVPHRDPKMGARIVSQTPQGMVPIADFGKLGFGEPGHAPTPHLPGPSLGATCVGEGTCWELSGMEASFYDAMGGERFLWLGDETTCIGVARCGEDAPTGACCMEGGACEVLNRADCLRRGGDYLGDESACSPDSCQAAGGSGGSAIPDSEGK